LLVLLRIDMTGSTAAAGWARDIDTSAVDHHDKEGRGGRKSSLGEVQLGEDTS